VSSDLVSAVEIELEAVAVKIGGLLRVKKKLGDQRCLIDTEILRR
jgi:hypothetical protein